MPKTKLLLIIALLSSSLNAMDKKPKPEEFNKTCVAQKVKSKPENVTPPLHATLWGKISSYLPRKDQMNMRFLTNSIKNQVDLNTDSIEIKGNLKNLTSLRSYLSNENLRIKQVQFTGNSTSFSVFQTIAEKIGKNLISLKGLRNDMFSMFKEDQYFYELFPNLLILHVLNDFGQHDDEEPHKDMVYKPAIEREGEDERFTILSELGGLNLREIEYIETLNEHEHSKYNARDTCALSHDIALAELFKCTTLKKITLRLEGYNFYFEGLPESVENLTLTFACETWEDDIINIMQGISAHENLRSLELHDFPLIGDGVEKFLPKEGDENFFPKNIQKLCITKSLITGLGEGSIFDAISNLLYLKKLELIDLNLEHLGEDDNLDTLDIFLNIPDIEELTISFDSKKPPKKHINFIIKTSCEKRNLTPMDNITFQINK